MCLHRWLRNMSYGTNDNGKERYNLMRKTLIIIIGVIIIMLTTICNIGLLEKWNRKNTIQLLIVGDSIGEGAGASDPAFKWYKYLIPYVEEQYGKKLEITNVSMGGNTSFAGYTRVMELRNNNNYDVVIVCYGQNDEEQNFSFYYEQMLQAIINKWPSCQLITILESSQREYTPKICSIQQLGEKYQAYVVDMVAVFNNDKINYEELCDDGTHPNDKGQEAYFTEIAKVFDEIYQSKDLKSTKHIEDTSLLPQMFKVYSKDEFSREENLRLDIPINRDVKRVGIDYDLIPGEHMLTVYFDEKATWEYSYRWEQSFEQRHIEEIYSGDEFINQLTVIFSSEEQMEGFHGIVVE